MIPIGYAVDYAGEKSPYHDWVFNLHINSDDIYLQFHQTGLSWQAKIVQATCAETDIRIQVQRCGTVNGLPHDIEVKLSMAGGDTQTVYLSEEDRISKASLQERRTRSFLPDSGYYPTIFISMLGAVGSGKSCFVCASKTHTVADGLLKLLPYGLATVHTKAVQKPLPPTALASVARYGFEILDRRGNISSLAFFVDLSGELTINHRPNRAHGQEMQLEDSCVMGNGANKQTVRRILGEVSKLNDALVVVLDERVFLPEKPVRGDVNQLLNQLRRQKRLPKHVCVVGTHSDVLQDLLQNQRAKLDLKGAMLCPGSPVFSAAVKEQNPREAMLQHMAIAKDVLGRQVDLDENTGYFLVQSLSETQDSQTGEKLFDFSRERNVELAVAYLVERLVRT
jgi:hypothetical protein